MKAGIIQSRDGIVTVSYRGSDQLLPGGCITFLDKQTLKDGIETLTEVVVSDDTIDVIWDFAGESIGHSWHPSNANLETVLDEVRFVLYWTGKAMHRTYVEGLKSYA